MRAQDVKLCNCVGCGTELLSPITAGQVSRSQRERLPPVLRGAGFDEDAGSYRGNAVRCLEDAG